MINFEESGLIPELLKAVKDLGFEQPTPIQEKTIPFILETNKDLVAQAQTGTGKTAAFGLPLIQLCDKDPNQVQALILCPTRELCVQITNDMKSFCTYLKNFHVTAVYGGAPMETQIKSLKHGSQIVVGTPGRVHDLIRRKALKISSLQWLVLDEADEMLNMGFREEIDAILMDTPENKKVFLFSATIPKEIRDIANSYMKDPVELSVGKKNIGAENVSHEYYIINARDRYEALKRIADINPNIYGIVFCRTRTETKEIADKLINDGYNADALHGDLSQAQRDHVTNRFRQKHLQMLIATDVAARGLDINDLTHVINYNLPDNPEIYIHRSGRTGRAGKVGVAISIAHSRETRKIRELENQAGKKFEKKPVPGGRQVCEKQLFALVDRVEKIEVDESQIEEYLPVIYKKLSWLSREELIQHFVSVEFNRFLTYYKDARDLNIPEKPMSDRRSDRSSDPDRRRSDRSSDSDRRRGDRSPDSDRRRGERSSDPDKRRSERSSDPDKRRSERSSDPEKRRSDRSSDSEERRSDRASDSERGDRTEFTRFHINLGSINGINAMKIIGLVNDNSRKRKVKIGKIEIMKKFSFFEVDSSFAADIPKNFTNVKYEGIPIEVDLSNPPPDVKPRIKRNKDENITHSDKRTRKPRGGSFADKRKNKFSGKKKW